MSERKVLNKYYPPDFDPTKIPRAKCGKNRTFTVRLMAPCNMKCYTCGEYIAQGKKFNARKEDVDDMNYLGIRIYRFYIRCPGCISEISFRTDPESTDYILEAGAHRNFQALKLAEAQAAKEAKDAQNEIESNPMLLLENRTQQSQYEMELMESLEDLKELNDRHARVDSGKIAMTFDKEKKLTEEQIDAAERLTALKALGYELIEGKMVKRLKEDSDDSDEEKESLLKKRKLNNPHFESDLLTRGSKSQSKNSQESLRSKFSGLIKLKSTPKCSVKTPDESKPSTTNTNGSNSEFKIPVIPPLKDKKDAATITSNSQEVPSNLPSVSKSISSTTTVSKDVSSSSSTKDASPSKVKLDSKENCSSSEPKSFSLLCAYSDSDSSDEG